MSFLILPVRWLLGLAALVAATIGLAAENAAPNTQDLSVQARYERARAELDLQEKAHGGYMQTRNIRMHYVSLGDSSGVPLIRAHGTYSNAYEMAPFAEQLVAAGYRIVAIDYYGHGLTPIPPHEVSLWHVADDIVALMDSLRLPRAIVGGWSRGGTVAAAFYDAYPARTLGLILEDGGSFSFLRNRDRMTDEELTKDSSRAPWFPLRSYPTEFDAFKTVMRKKVVVPEQGASPWDFQALARLSRDEAGGWRVNRGLATWLEEETPETAGRMNRRPSLSTLFQFSTIALEPMIIFRNLAVPMLIVDPVSAKDVFVAGAMNEQLQRAHPALVTHRVYPDTSHAAKFERPEWFIRDAIDLLRTVRERSNR